MQLQWMEIQLRFQKKQQCLLKIIKLANLVYKYIFFVNFIIVCNVFIKQK